MNFSERRWAGFMAGIMAIIAFSALAIILNFRRISGDGPTYLATAVTLLSHHSSAMGADALAYAEQITGRYPGVIRPGMDGQMHSVHFWGYALLVMPLVAITRATGVLRGQEFFLLNIVLAISILGAMLRLSKYRGEMLLAFAFILCSSVALYLRWSGPEVLSTMMLCAAIACLRSSRFGWAVLLTAISGMQNPTINLFQLINGLWFLAVTPHGRFWRSVPGLVPWVLGSLAITALPFIWSLHTFGALNAVNKGGYASLSFATTAKLVSLYTDLNQGFPVAGVVLFPAMILFIGLRLARRTKKLAVHDLLLPAVLLITAPVIVQIAWNPGTFVYLRYWTWGIVPLAFWVAIELNAHGSRAGIVTMLAASLLHAILLFWNNSHYDGGRPSHQPWVRALWSVAPGLYTPEPEIFLERTIGNIKPPLPRQWTAWSAQPGVLAKMSVSSDLEPELQKAVGAACKAFGYGWSGKPLGITSRALHPKSGLTISFVETPIRCTGGSPSSHAEDRGLTGTI